MEKPRVIVTTDGEGDDQCSMVRFLLYANGWDIRGLIHSSSKHHWKGNEEIPEKKWPDPSWLDNQIDQYALVYENLKEHDAGYPSPENLREQMFVGNIEYEGDMEHPTPGSDRIAEVLLEPDLSPVWLQVWGGPNTIARALKTIEENYPERMAEVAEKARIFMIAKQDHTWDTYISQVWPKVRTVHCSRTYLAIAYRWRDIMSEAVQGYFSTAWLAENILKDHGPLCALYPTRPDGSFRSEGDSPAFMHTIDVGLQNLDRPEFGGWGGRYEWRGSRWVSVPDDGDIYKPILRWAIAFQNDWAVRADWCVKEYGDANHPPVVVLSSPGYLKCEKGERVQLDATGSMDPDGDGLTFRWWHYPEPGTYRGVVHIDDADEAKATFIMPDDASDGETIHVICEVIDDGLPSLARYSRVIVEVLKRGME